MTDYITDYFSKLADGLFDTLKNPSAYLDKIALTAVIILVGLFLHVLIRKLIEKNTKDAKRLFLLKKVLKQTMLTIVVLLSLFVWIQAINVLILIALLFGVIVVFMVRGLTSNIIGYFVIKYRRYFEIGHRIEINELIGDVMEINSTNFKLLEVRGNLSSDANTGRVIKLPNSIIFDNPVQMVGIANTFVWHEIRHVLSFDSDWQAAEQIMTAAGAQYFRDTVEPNLGERNSHLPSDKRKLQPVFSLNVDDTGIILVLRYLVDYQSGTSVRTRLQREILTKFDAHPKIEFAALEVKVFS